LKGGKADLVFYAFDLLEFNGEDIANLPQVERKKRLLKLLGSGKGARRACGEPQSSE
jgi:ATP-dependent DNA ligase